MPIIFVGALCLLLAVDLSLPLAPASVQLETMTAMAATPIETPPAPLTVAPVVAPVTVAAPAPAPVAPTSLAQDVAVKVHDIRVQIVAKNSAVVGAPMPGRLIAMPLHDGDRFAKMDVLAKFDCNGPMGSFAKAKALLEEKTHIFQAQEQLHKLGTSSGVEFGVAEAQMHEAQADVATTQALIDKCVIKAPYNGRLANVAAHENQVVGESTPLFEIVSDGDLELQMVVPSVWLSWLKPGTSFDIDVIETNHSYSSAVTQISGKVDPVSQSITVYGKLKNKAPELLPGMSGRARFTPPENSAK